MNKSTKILKLLAVSAFVTSLAASPAVFAANGPEGQPLQPSGMTGGETRAEKAGQFVDDATITAKVKAALLAETALKALEINVETTQGIVKLTGTVDTKAEKEKAMSIAQKVSGVKSIKDDLVLREAGKEQMKK